MPHGSLAGRTGTNARHWSRSVTEQGLMAPPLPKDHFPLVLALIEEERNKREERNLNKKLVINQGVFQQGCEVHINYLSPSTHDSTIFGQIVPITTFCFSNLPIVIRDLDVLMYESVKCSLENNLLYHSFDTSEQIFGWLTGIWTTRYQSSPDLVSWYGRSGLNRPVIPL